MRSSSGSTNLYEGTPTGPMPLVSKVHAAAVEVYDALMKAGKPERAMTLAHLCSEKASESQEWTLRLERASSAFCMEAAGRFGESRLQNA